jgi:hypothetical protein
MSSWRVLLLSLIAVLFVASGTARAALPPSAPPPCHDMSGGPATQDKPPHPDIMPASCCQGCLPNPPLGVTLSLPAEHPERPTFELRDSRREGLSPPPELGPPRRGA